MSDDNAKKDIDALSGVETTGHEWDGLKELNNPAPRWWLWVFYITCIWSVWYWVVYPAWPTLSGATTGTQGYTQFNELEKSQSEIIARQQAYLEKFHGATFEQIMRDPALYEFAMAGGKSAFKDNCATCHGSGGAGGKGYPNLNDDDWLWGGTVEDIYQTLQFGIRSGYDQARMSQMPAFGKDNILKPAEISAVVDYALTLSGAAKPRKDFEQGRQIFEQNCASCHGADGKGGRDFGAPNLTDAIWLYGGDRKTVYETVYNSRAGVMPSWQNRLDDNTIRQLSIYVHELGGGEETKVEPTPAPEEAQNITTEAAQTAVEQDVDHGAAEGQAEPAAQ